MDRMKIVRASNITVPVNTPVTYKGNEIGKVIDNDDADSILCINSDEVVSLLRSNATYSLEVIGVEEVR